MGPFSETDLEIILNEKVKEYNTPAFLPSDPLGVVHQYSEKRNIEIMGFLIATIAWGNRKSIINNAHKLGQLFDHAPYEFVMNATKQEIEALHFVHRTFNSEDLQTFVLQLRKLYQKANSLESYFHPHSDHAGIKGRIVSFRESFLNGLSEKHRSKKHISNPATGSSAKRINMYLRWMCRPNDTGVDFGLWHEIPKEELCIPLDVHTGNVARALGLTSRKQNDWKTLEEIMESLRSYDSSDPAKYDFALFGIGVMDELQLRK